MEDLVHVPRLKLRTSRAWLVIGLQSVMLPCVCLCGDVGFFFFGGNLCFCGVLEYLRGHAFMS